MPAPGRRRSGPRPPGGDRDRRRGSRPARPRAAPRPRRGRRRARCPANTGGTSPDGELDVIAKAVTDAGETAAAADLPPARCFEDDVNALAREPFPLVEAVALRARLGHADARLQDRSSRRRAADGKHEEHPLAERSPPELRVTAMTRVANGDERAGATVTSSTTPDSPTSDARKLRRSASMRIEPQPRPRTARATPAPPTRAKPSSKTTPTSATPVSTPTAASGTEIQIESPIPAHAEATSSAGQWSSTRSCLTA